jgi:molybdate transport system substrate-binding protein
VLSSSVELFFVIALLLWLPLFAAPQTPTLTIAAAADLIGVEQPLTRSFERAYSDITVRFTTAASGVLKQQIENGAPYDIFLSANARYLDDLVQKGAILKDSAVDYAQGEIGVVWRDGVAHQVQDLAAPAVQFLALPNPKLAPYGVAARQALTRIGLWSSVQSKIVYGENVQQTWQLFESGNADAVITSWSILYNRRGSLLDPSLYAPITQRGGIVASTTNLQQARKFMIFLTGPDGASILASHGLRAAPLKRKPIPARRIGPG